MKIGFGKRLKELRVQRGLKQKELGEILLVAESTVACWENEMRQCDYQTIIKLAKFFDVSTDYLFGLAEI